MPSRAVRGTAKLRSVRKSNPQDLRTAGSGLGAGTRLPATVCQRRRVNYSSVLYNIKVRLHAETKHEATAPPIALRLVNGFTRGLCPRNQIKVGIELAQKAFDKPGSMVSSVPLDASQLPQHRVKTYDCCCYCLTAMAPRGGEVGPCNPRLAHGPTQAQSDGDFEPLAWAPERKITVYHVIACQFLYGYSCRRGCLRHVQYLTAITAMLLFSCRHSLHCTNCFTH